jgi:subtilisin family serine protease
MKKWRRVALPCSAVVLSLNLASAGAQESAALSEADIRGNLWFVELSAQPTADGNSLSSVQSSKSAFKKAAKAAGISYTVRRSFDVLFNGYSIEIDAANRARLAGVSGVKAVWPVEVIQAPPVEDSAGGSSPDLATAITMTGADVAQDTLGLTGDGVRVAVIDTGVDYHHPDLGGCFGAGCRVASGYDFVGDAFNADPSSLAYNPVTVPDTDPDDCNGHGTHVAGIIGASAASASGVTGVAPGVTYGAYRVFGCGGSTTADIMISAMEQALADDMDVLNMSIGSAFQWPQYPTAQAADRLVNKGVVVVTSIGNSGANGLFSASAPGLGKKVIGTAAVDNIAVTLSQFTISPDDLAIGYSSMTGSVAAPTSGSMPMARTGTATTTNDACFALPAGSLTGMAALIRRGACTFATKALNAQAAGAVAVVIYNNAPGRFAGTIAGSGVTIPTVQISGAEGVTIDGRLASGPVTMTWQSGVGSFPNPTGGLVSSFSSYGLSPDLTVKPDISAPGGLIYSTFPVELGSFATISGTSMASPHVAGAAALLLEAHPNTNAHAARGILQNSADPGLWWGNPGLGFLDNVHRQGAGLVDIDGAILATTQVEPSKIAAGEGAAGPFVQTLAISNDGPSAVTYNLSYVNALSTGANTFTPSFHTSDATVGFSAPSVLVPAGGTASVLATINPATTPVGGQYGGYIVLTDAADATKLLRVPFAGYIGDYQARPVLTGGFPFLGKLTNCTPAAVLRGLECFGASAYSVHPAGATYDLTTAINQTPYILVHLDHQARRLRLEVFDAVSGAAWHYLSNDEYLPRNSTATSFFALPWNGTTFAGKGKNPSQQYTVPDGQYVVKVSVLKALGDESNPAHWETWTSPVITIDRP